MGYQHGKTNPSGGLLPLEQARRRNAELRLALLPIAAEHSQLTAEKAELDAKVEALRAEVAAARKKLTRQIKDLEAIRIQTANIAALAEQAASTEPVFGGPAGLQAAADEAAEHEGKLLGTVARKGPSGPSHGTARKYALGCRCEVCLDWRKRASTRTLAGMKRKREREIAAAVEQATRAA